MWNEVYQLNIKGELMKKLPKTVLVQSYLDGRHQYLSADTNIAAAAETYSNVHINSLVGVYELKKYAKISIPTAELRDKKTGKQIFI